MATNNYTKGFVQVYHEVESSKVQDVIRWYDNKDTLDYWFGIHKSGSLGEYILTDSDKKLVKGICIMLKEKLSL